MNTTLNMTEMEMVTGGAKTPFGIGMPTESKPPIPRDKLIDPWDLPSGYATQDALLIALKFFGLWK